MSLLNLAWHQPLLIPLMGEALPLREREGDGERGEEGVRGKEREECPRPGSHRILVKRRAGREHQPGSLGLSCKYLVSSLTQPKCVGRSLMRQ